MPFAGALGCLSALGSAHLLGCLPIQAWCLCTSTCFLPAMSGSLALAGFLHLWVDLLISKTQMLLGHPLKAKDRLEAMTMASPLKIR